MKVEKEAVFMFLFIILFSGTFSTSVNTSMISVSFVPLDGQSFESSLASNSHFSETLSKKFIDAELLNSTGPTRVISIVRDDVALSDVAKYMMSARATPSFNGFHIVRGLMLAENVAQLDTNPYVVAILKDEKINYDAPIEFPEVLAVEDLSKLKLESRSENWLFGKPETTLREVVNITGARKAWETYDVNGANTTIAIVDTGVDYGSLSLGYWDAVARDSLGYSATFDADAEGMVITNTTITNTFTKTGKDRWLETNGTDPYIYFVLAASYSRPLIPPVIKWSELAINGTVFPFPMNITGIRSQSGKYHFGLMTQYWNMVPTWLILQIFPVLVVDSVTSGVYDTVYVDISYDWAWLGFLSLESPEILPYWPGTWPPELSFADETPVTPTGRIVAARDFTGDGIYDLSAGTLGYFLDVWKASPNVEDRGQILKPIALDGDYVVFVNDWWGHGTMCASSAAGRDLTSSLAGPGMAPEAKIMGIVALYLGDVIEADLWAAGFDLIPGSEGWRNVTGYGTVWGTWNYTGNHTADVISHSWGFSRWAKETLGKPWYTVLTVFEDALTVPGYFASDYPGIVIVHAGGNGAAGYGTVTEPAYATLPITVGASTSMNWSRVALGFAGGSYDEVIPWSARGPTPLGNVKPDVVNIGARGWAAEPVWSGLGNGSLAYDLFGGTSMATPLTAGASALIIQAHNRKYGGKPSPELTKVVLKSSAKDLGYDAFVQGSGRVDAFAAVELVLAMSGITVTSSATWKNIRSKIANAWATSYRSLGETLSSAPPDEPIFNVDWFAGTIKPGESTTTEFTIENPTNQSVEATITPVTHEQIGTPMTYSGHTGSMPFDWRMWRSSWVPDGWAWGDLTILERSDIPNGTELMVASLRVPYEYFDENADYSWDRRWGIMILNWVDAPPYNGIVEINEVYLLNYGYNFGTSNEARVGFPLSKIKGKPVIFVYQRGISDPVPFNVSTSFYRRNPWTWVETLTSISVSSNSSKTFIANLTVPANTPQGVYEGQIKIDITAPYNKTMAVPVSLQVPAILPADNLVYNITSLSTGNLYDSFKVNGYFDWSWRYESGDWKQWVFTLQDSDVVAAFVSSSWIRNMTDIDMFGINPVGIMVDGAMSPNLGGGIFLWKTRTGTKEEYVVFDTRNFAYPQLGTYTVLLHNVLFDGTIYPENVTGRVELVKLLPSGPVDVTTRSGRSALQNFTITSGRNLTDIKLFADYGSSPFSAKFTPDRISSIDAMGSTKFTMRIDAPSDIPEGIYPFRFFFQAKELPFQVLVFVNIVVDNTSPIAEFITPTASDYIKGDCNITIFAFDANLNLIQLSVDGDNLTSWATSGIHSFVWGTSSINGVRTIVLDVYDKAGAKTERTIAVTVDNTLPSVGIVRPQAEDELSGVTTINFTASDTNLKLMQLLIDRSIFNVTGTTHFQWNTTKVGDGAHIIKLIAYDKAGNTAETSIPVNTINSKLNFEAERARLEASRNLYLAIGMPLSFMVGVLIVYIIFKRKK